MAKLFVLSLLIVLIFILHPQANISSTAIPIQANIIVALDGSSPIKSINEAIDMIPNHNENLFVILVKEVVYNENVLIKESKTNVMMIGEGMEKTIIESNRSVKGGFYTDKTATMEVQATNFVAKDLAIINNAGPQGEQAVALRTGNSQIAFHRCSIQGYQDTLFAAFGEQFFSECQIFGTVDFIFGEAAVVIQNSSIFVRKLLPGQPNVITAQGRRSDLENNGIVLHNCTITSAPEFFQIRKSVETYLGRPWKTFSRTIIMESFLDDLIHPKGWLDYNGTSALPTLYYAEYRNFGPGANTNGRVQWSGYHVLTDPKLVRKFTVKRFINGTNWLPGLGVPFIPGLLN
ncbi:Pectinesterase, catalytic [Corchorus capsularis]|uniref:Pectinesterase n=1 Tax=Corchorus capsularis TaxID=210143 RepID=A0A1R3GYD4_COCAP|nr:Pectinesterase, catalytic [Corchorus capsularis]